MIAKTILMLGCFAAMLLTILFTPKLREHTPLFLISFLTVVGTVLFPQWLFQAWKRWAISQRERLGAPGGTAADVPAGA